jgi:hypothetical protein
MPVDYQEHRLRALLKDDASGYRLAWQLVVDGLKVTPANPTFLQARDDILLALDHMRDQRRVQAAVYLAARTAAWTAFARFGMGANASSDDAGVDNIVADTSLSGTSERRFRTRDVPRAEESALMETPIDARSQEFSRKRASLSRFSV